jgi:hypothetical protein
MAYCCVPMIRVLKKQALKNPIIIGCCVKVLLQVVHII